MREYGIDLLASNMSWRRFLALYAGLSPDSLTCLNYRRVAAELGLSGAGAEDAAWAALVGATQ